MQPFTRTIERAITIRSSVRGIPDAVWVLSLGDDGLTVRRSNGDKVHRTWRQIIGWFLVHA